MKKNSAWIFLSHSSADIEKVRMIRNAFEEQGHNPLAFHLRCLQTNTAEGRAELDDLIKREIDARQWFVFCESDHAAESPYVQMERDYILQSKKRKVWTINMNDETDVILKRVKEISRDLMVYVDAVRYFGNTYRRMVEQKFAEYEYTVAEPCEVDFEERGFVVFVICEKDLQHLSVLLDELEDHIHTFGHRLIPLLVGDFDYEPILNEFCEYDAAEFDPIRISVDGNGFEQVVERIRTYSGWTFSAEMIVKSCQNILNMRSGKTSSQE